MAERKWRAMNSVAEQHYATSLYRMVRFKLAGDRNKLSLGLTNAQYPALTNCRSKCFEAWIHMHNAELKIRAFRFVRSSNLYCASHSIPP